MRDVFARHVTRAVAPGHGAPEWLGFKAVLLQQLTLGLVSARAARQTAV